MKSKQLSHWSSALVALASFATFATQAATRTWDGGGANNNWSLNTNWVGNVTPSAGDDLVFPAGAPRANSTNNLPAATVFNSITINSNSYSLNGNAVLINRGVHGAVASSSASVNLALTLTQPQTFTNSGAGTLQFNAPVDNGGFDLTLRVNAGTNLFQSAAGILGGGGLVKSGAGVLRFAGGTANTYGGQTTVNEGSVELAKTSSTTSIPGNLIIGDGIGGAGADVVRGQSGQQIADSSAVAINSSGLLTIGSSETIGGLNGNGLVSMTGNTLLVNLTSGTNTFSGSISGPQGFTKFGAGTMILSGTNTHTGTTRLQGGVLQVDGFQPASPVFVGGGTRFRGSGTVGTIEVNGNSSVIAPGNSPGILTSSNYHVGTGTGMLDLELNGIEPGSGHDQVNVRGTVNLAGQALSVSLNFPGAPGHAFVIINNDGADAVINPFPGRAEGVILAAGGELFRLSYVGGDGNDVVLTQLKRPQLRIEKASASTVRLLWATNNAAGFILQSNTNLITFNWSSVSPAPVTTGTNNAVTNTLTGQQKFYRLFKP